MALRWFLLFVFAAASALPAAAQTPRPLPHPVVTPPTFAHAVEAGTRTVTGEPGPRYWQQRAHYTLRAALDTTAKRLTGDVVIRYRNNSPDTLGVVVLKLRQNLHREGVPRTRTVEITGGMDVENVRVDGFAVTDVGRSNAAGTYTVDGTQLYLRPRLPILPGREATISMDWSFRIPEAGAPRMGQDGEVYYLGYWYPQVAVYDDVVGWDTDPYLGLGEHYMGYGDYDVRITVPEGFLVGATGVLQNPDEVLRADVRARLRTAATSDEPVAIVPVADLGRATADAPDGALTWHFTAENVRDFAFGTSDAYVWDATRANVGDRDGDGADDFTAIHTLYRPGATAWDRSAEYARFAIADLSATLFPYPYPHMTAVEGLIGGGMEYPMITLIGGARSAQGLFWVAYHEIAHMWFPMVVGQDEADFAWMDEGLASFLTNAGTDAYYGAETRMRGIPGGRRTTSSPAPAGPFPRCGTPIGSRRVPRAGSLRTRHPPSFSMPSKASPGRSGSPRRSGPTESVGRTSTLIPTTSSTRSRTCSAKTSTGSGRPRCSIRGPSTWRSRPSSRPPTVSSCASRTSGSPRCRCPSRSRTPMAAPSSGRSPSRRG